MKNFCSYLKENATNIIDFEKKKNVTFNRKNKKQITSRCNGMLNLEKKIIKRYAKDKKHLKFKGR